MKINLRKLILYCYIKMDKYSRAEQLGYNKGMDDIDHHAFANRNYSESDNKAEFVKRYLQGVARRRKEVGMPYEERAVRLYRDNAANRALGRANQPIVREKEPVTTSDYFKSKESDKPEPKPFVSKQLEKLMDMSVFGENILRYLKRRDALVLNSVNNTLHQSVSRHNWRARFIEKIRVNNSSRNLSLTPDESRILACDLHKVDIYDTNDFKNTNHLVTYEDGFRSEPTDTVVVPLTGEVLVLDGKRWVVYVFQSLDSDTIVRRLGEEKNYDIDYRSPFFLRGEKHDGDLQLHDPTGITVLDGDIHTENGPIAVIADQANNRLSLLRVRDGSLVRHIGNLFLPFAVRTIPRMYTGYDDECLIVTDTIQGVSPHVKPWPYGPLKPEMVNLSSRVQILTRTGMVLRTFQSNDLVKVNTRLHGLTISDINGGVEILATDHYEDRVVSWRLKDGSGPRIVCDGLKRPTGLVANRTGTLWVNESNNLVKFEL